MPKKMLKVKATDPARPVPLERSRPRRHPETGANLNAIGAEPREVPATPYYRRRLAAGELARVDAPKGKAAKLPGLPPAGGDR